MLYCDYCSRLQGLPLQQYFNYEIYYKKQNDTMKHNVQYQRNYLQERIEYVLVNECIMVLGCAVVFELFIDLRVKFLESALFLLIEC